jgi:hypothetical protein
MTVMNFTAHRYSLLTSIAAFGMFLLGASGCLQPPDFPLEPVVTFESLSRDSMIQGSLLEDSITVTLSFTDGDGDIALLENDTFSNVFLENRRTGETVGSFKIDPIPEMGAENGISGDIALRVFTTCCDYPPFVLEFPCQPSRAFPVDTLLLEAFIIDRAGNESNRVNLPPVFLICDNF